MHYIERHGRLDSYQLSNACHAYRELLVEGISSLVKDWTKHLTKSTPISIKIQHYNVLGICKHKKREREREGGEISEQLCGLVKFMLHREGVLIATFSLT